MNEEEDVLIHPDFALGKPPCFRSNWQYEDFIEAEILQYDDMKVDGPLTSGYCTYCTPWFQRKMKAEGRCLHPGVKFTLDEDGFRGHRPDEGKPVMWLKLFRG